MQDDYNGCDEAASTNDADDDSQHSSDEKQSIMIRTPRIYTLL